MLRTPHATGLALGSHNPQSSLRYVRDSLSAVALLLWLDTAFAQAPEPASAASGDIMTTIFAAVVVAYIVVACLIVVRMIWVIRKNQRNALKGKGTETGTRDTIG